MGEKLDEEALAFFDLLTKPQIEMSDADTILTAEKLVHDWRKLRYV